MQIYRIIFQGAIIVSLLLAVTLASTQRVQARVNKSYEWKLGHQWTFTYDHTQRSGELWVAIGQWRWQTREFRIDAEYNYPVACSAKSSATVCELDIFRSIENAYMQSGYTKGTFRVGATEYYQDIVVDAIGTWSSLVDHKSVLAHHPSMSFSTTQNGNSTHFQTMWQMPAVKGWSAPFKTVPGVEVNMRNTVIWEFEQAPNDYSKSLYEVSIDKNDPMDLGGITLPALPGRKFAFQLTSAQITIMPPSNLQLKTFIIDPKYGHGD